MVKSIAIAIALVFSAGASAQALSKADYKSAKDGIAAEYKSAKTACAALSGGGRDGTRGTIRRQICELEAKGKRDVAKAELEARHSPTDENRRAVTVAKVKAQHAVLRKKCEEADQVRQACLDETKAAETRAMAAAAKAD
ncbi:MAG TPA: hypothetical protein VM183_00950 [Burkholderiales bacterium]|nr:hypothetical protein [Burkholderiales bacterium]